MEILYFQSSLLHPVSAGLEDHADLGGSHTHVQTTLEGLLVPASACVLTCSPVWDQVLPACAEFQEQLACSHTLHTCAVYNFQVLELHQEVFSNSFFWASVNETPRGKTFLSRPSNGRLLLEHGGIACSRGCVQRRVAGVCLHTSVVSPGLQDYLLV